MELAKKLDEKDGIHARNIRKRITSERWVNIETGECKDFTVLQKEVTDKNFYKVWLYDLINVLDKFGSKKVKVLNYILDNINPHDNTFAGTVREISDLTHTSPTTVQEVLNILTESNFLKRIRIAHYQINPSILAQGSHSKRTSIMIDYNSVKEPEQVEMEFELADATRP